MKPIINNRGRLHLPLILLLAIIFLISGITINAFSETSTSPQTTESITNSSEPLAEKNQRILNQLNKKRQQYYKKKNELVSRHDSELKQLKDKKTVLNKKIGDAKKEISSLQKNLHKSQDNLLYIKRIQKIIAIGLYPLGSIFPTYILGLFLYIFFPLTILNGCIYLYFRERSFFLLRKKAILITAGLLLLLFLIPAFAQGATKLEKCEQIMSLTDLQRIIKRLESAKLQKGKILLLPETTTRNPILKPLNKVKIGFPSYYITLAAFYFEDNRKGMAVDAIKKIYDHHSTFLDQAQIPFATNGIKFLLEQEQIESASQAIPKVLPYIKDVSVLLDLADFLERAHMDKSARETLQQAINIASDPDELIKLSRFLVKKDRLEDAIQSTGKAIKFTKDLNKLIEIIEVSLENGMEDIVTTGINKSIRLARTPEEYFLMVDFLLKNNRLEQAANILSHAINSIKKDRRGYAIIILRRRRYCHIKILSLRIKTLLCRPTMESCNRSPDLWTRQRQPIETQ
jgi:tetratricopeptide (TPR) repeat protein